MSCKLALIAIKAPTTCIFN